LGFGTAEVGVQFRYQIKYGDSEYEEEEESEPAVRNHDYKAVRSAHLRSINGRVKDAFHDGNIIPESERAVQVKGRGYSDGCMGCCGEDIKVVTVL
jgi:hypothetical protein